MQQPVNVIANKFVTDIGDKSPGAQFEVSEASQHHLTYQETKDNSHVSELRLLI